jgi:hypothetical protein
MLHANFTPIALCFAYTSWYFYAFSGTNLLTRCHSASSCFLLFLCLRKVTQKIFSELDKTKPKVPIFPSTRQSPKQRRRRARRWPHHLVARVHPWPRHHLVWAPWCPLTSPLRLYKASDAKTLNQSAFSQIKFRSAAAIADEVWGERSLYFGTLPGRGIAPGAVSIDSTPIFIAVAVSYDEDVVVLPRG